MASSTSPLLSSGLNANPAAAPSTAPSLTAAPVEPSTGALNPATTSTTTSALNPATTSTTPALSPATSSTTPASSPALPASASSTGSSAEDAGTTERTTVRRAALKAYTMSKADEGVCTGKARCDETRWDDVAQQIRAKTLDADLLRQHMLLSSDPVPESLRGHVWMVLLGLGKRIGKDTYDHIGSEVSFEEREPAIKECSKVLLRLPDKELVAESFLKDASLVVTYYARLTARPVDALRRLISLAVPFFALKLPRSDLFACFYSFMERFGILETALSSGVVDRLVSALLLFHDPALALHFKSLGVLQALPSLCALPGMFVGRSTVATSVALLQALIVEHDSTMPLFVLVASLMEQRPMLLDVKDRTAMEACLGKLPTPASPAPSPSELLLRARHLRSRTPESALAVYLRANVLVTAPLAPPLNRRSSVKPSSPVVGAATSTATSGTAPPASALPPPELTEAGLVLPVEELFTVAPAGDWHIVDLRAAVDAHPSSGVPLRSTALDPALIVGDPEQLQGVATELAAHLGEYIAVLPRRRTDAPADTADLAAAMFYLQSTGFAHVALVDGGGFGAFHAHAVQTSSPLLVEHEPRKCPLCRAAATSSGPATTTSGSASAAHAGAVPSVTALVADTAAAAAARVSSTLGALWASTTVSTAPAPAPAAASAATSAPAPPARPVDGGSSSGGGGAATATVTPSPWMARLKETSTVLSQRLKTATENITAVAMAAVDPLEEDEAPRAVESSSSLVPESEEDDEPLDKKQLRGTTDWLLDPTVHMFPCREYLAAVSRHYARTVVVTPTEVLLCREHPTRPQAVYVLATYALHEVRRITSKKTHTNIITLVVRAETAPTAPTAPAAAAAGAEGSAARLMAHTLIFKDATDFVDLLKSRLRTLTSSAVATPTAAEAPGPEQSSAGSATQTAGIATVAVGSATQAAGPATQTAGSATQTNGEPLS